ncbi:MAG: DNA-3-methyladenine glycosylase [Steroidobacteraceae bacterium]
MANKLSRDFYLRDTLDVARDLLGTHLVHRSHGGTRVGRIVETEAYQGPEDLAAHSSKGQTPRNSVMFGEAGHAYVYLIYGMWNCVNVVTREAGVPHAVLIRAVEPIAGLDNHTHGPGLLCRAFGIDRNHNGLDLLGNQLWIETGTPPREITTAPRIGVDYAGDWAHRPWRFYDSYSGHVSTLSAAQRRKRQAQR